MNLEIEKLRTYNESNRHWACRKAFLEKNWDDYDHERVNCLSLCWTNKLFYGSNGLPTLRVYILGLGPAMRRTKFASGIFEIPRPGIKPRSPA